MKSSITTGLLVMFLLVGGFMLASGCTPQTTTESPMMTRDVLSTEELGVRIISLPTLVPSPTVPPDLPTGTPCCAPATEAPLPEGTQAATEGSELTPTTSGFKPGGKQWAAVYRSSGNAIGRTVVETRNGNFLILGRHSVESSVARPWLLQLASDGSILWQKTFTDIFPYALYPTLEGGFLLIGAESLVKFDAEGSLHWQNTYNRPQALIGYPQIGVVLQVDPSSDGGATLLSRGGVVSRVNRGGALEWQEIFPEAWSDSAPVAWMLPDAGLAGGREGRGGFWIQRNGSASPSWRRTITFTEKDVPTREPLLLRGMEDGGVLFIGPVVAYTRLGGSDLYFVRLNPSGEIVWQLVLQGGDEYDLNAVETRDGGLLITGITNFGSTADPPGGSYLRLIRINQAGTLLWDRLFGDGEQEIDINALIQSRDGGFVMVGELAEPIPEQPGRSGGLFVLKVNRSGQIPGCAWSLDSPLATTVVPAPTALLEAQEDFARFQGDFEVTEGGFRPFEMVLTEAQGWQACVYPSP